MSTQQELRIAKTESFFRNVNERIAETAARFGSQEAEFMCECDDQACVDRIEIPLDEYEHVRDKSTRFVLKPGHENESVERVVEREPEYRIVEKFNRTVASLARKLDPRAEPA